MAEPLDVKINHLLVREKKDLLNLMGQLPPRRRAVWLEIFEETSKRSASRRAAASNGS